jgi:hypothetical protein
VKEVVGMIVTTIGESGLRYGVVLMHSTWMFYQYLLRIKFLQMQFKCPQRGAYDKYERTISVASRINKKTCWTPPKAKESSVHDNKGVPKSGMRHCLVQLSK